MIDLAKELAKLTLKPFSVKPNAGQPRLNEKQIVHYDQPVKEFVKDIQQMITLGAKIVGGCCGTSPETIKMIKELIDSLEK
jgi:methionine synthase I (cobalamin-dependent)